MPKGLEPPCFREISDALLEQVRWDIRREAIAEPFMAGFPMPIPGMEHAHLMLQRRLLLIAEAQRLFTLMAPYEWGIRSLVGVQFGHEVFVHGFGKPPRYRWFYIVMQVIRGRGRH